MRSTIVVASFCLASLPGIDLSAQEQVTLKNRFRENSYIQLTTDGLASGPIAAQPGGAMWVLEPVAGTDFVRFRNAATSDQYIHVEDGPVASGAVPVGYWTSHWQFEPVANTNFVRIRNRFRGEQYLHLEAGPVESGAVPAGYWTSHWEIVPEDAPGAETYLSLPGTNQRMTVDELRVELRDGGFTLVENDELGPNECAVVYAGADLDDIAVDAGLLMCTTELDENVTLSSQLVYGGCDASNPLNEGVGGRCDVGVITENLQVKFEGGETNFDIEGPAASACGSASTERVCANVGATLASSSFAVTDDKGSGFGLSLEAGVGAGLSGSYEEGILSASLNLKFIAGASISFSINTTEVEKVLKSSEDAFILVGGEMVAAGNTVVKAFEQAGEDVVQWTVDAFEGKKLSRELAPGEGYLSVFNQAGYVTRVAVVYVHDGLPTSDVRDITAGFTAEFFIPPGAIGIILSVTPVATFDTESLQVAFASSEHLLKAYKFWGTIFDVEYAEISATR